VDKGKNFEKTVASLYQQMGFEVETNKMMEGSSGASHEIDIYCSNGSKRIAIECKCKDKVEKADIAVFILKLDDLKIKEGHVVSESCFSENAILTAKTYNICLVDGKELTKLFKKYGIEYRFSTRSNDPLSYMIRSSVNLLDELLSSKKEFKPLTNNYLSGMCYGKE
jgi:restriction endonuclease Mrr